MNISQVAKAVGLTTKTLRYYESIGLVAAAKRADNGYREYGEAELAMLKFIQRARSNGFSLQECRQLLDQYRDPERQSSHVKQMVLDKVADLDAQIEALQQSRLSLLAMAGLCAGNEQPHCAIIDSLAGADQSCHKETP